MIHSLVNILATLVYPLNLALLLMFVGYLLRWRKRTRLGNSAVVLGFIVLIGFSLPLTSGALTKTLERQHLPTPIEQITPADAIVVLGGSVSPAYPPRLYPGLTGASNREFHAARLFKADKAPWVIVSGEPDGGTLLLEQFGVPADRILEDTQSRSTRENALEALKIIEQRDDIDRVLLVTSAMHMPRALATFKKAGVNATAAPTDYNVVDTPEDRRRPFIMNLLPNAGSLNGSTRAIHEYLGCIYYWINGWI